MTGNMYIVSAKQWNPFAGCLHECSYCVPSFQGALKRWAKKNCTDCYHFEPHNHPERLAQSLPRTGDDKFIFTCSSGDVAFCDTPYLKRILNVIVDKSDRRFLLQSKNPGRAFNRRGIKFPDNVLLGITLETNRDDLARRVSRAPAPLKRYQDFLKVNHSLKMVTVEPILDFDLPTLRSWIRKIKPELVWVGYDSKKCRLPEPPLKKTEKLCEELEARGIKVMRKTMRKAWDE